MDGRRTDGRAANLACNNNKILRNDEYVVTSSITRSSVTAEGPRDTLC